MRNYHLYRKETYLCKGFNLLFGIMSNEPGRQVACGGAFIFINKPRTHLKLLVYELGGLIFFYRCIEKEAFKFMALIWMQVYADQQ